MSVKGSTPERLSSLETGLENHKAECVTDKINNKERFDSLDNKLWAIIAGVIINLVVLVGYLVTDGVPWQPKVQIADRGGSK